MSRLRFSIRGPAEAHLRQAVRGWPHPGRLQHPEGGGGLPPSGCCSQPRCGHPVFVLEYEV
ncbi:unnamed protein product [Musa acuminata subsp. malaccensis]|uniref:(wild Malaysian banana) hypothetical protein n=1 Tax=Musa acuminata subsp. malaccensis TaxID=214687 RepID=A0A804KP74_MUSAM|nr:unnamed protein product [Musa acuminata subsp. malaccensis]